MKNLIRTATLLFILPAVILGVSACKKELSNIPNIDFKTGGIYTSSSTTVDADAQVPIGITISKPENGDALNDFAYTYTVNNSTTVMAGNVYDLESHDTYSNTFNLFAPSTAGERHNYTFTVTTVSGASKSIKLSITAR